MNKIYDTIYKVDSKGKVRVWYVEQSGDRYRNFDGTQGGKIKCSEWRLAESTNDGRANARDGTEQATFEIEAKYKNKLEKDYHTSIESAQSNGSHIYEVMLAAKYETFVPGFAQPKLDGFRCIVNSSGMWSRAGKPFVSSPHIFEALKALLESNPDLVFDGELYNHELHDDFNEIQSLITVKSENKLTEEHFTKTAEMVQYHIYDLPSHPGTFSERLEALEELLISVPECIQIVETHPVETQERFDDFHAVWLESGFEGSMWRADSKYEHKRGKSLQKRKDFVDQEFELVLIEEGQGNWSGAAKSVYFKVPGAKLNFGDMFVNPDSLELLRWTSEVTPAPGAIRVAKAGVKGSYKRGVELLTEKHNIVTVKYFQLTPDGVPRFGVATKFHGEERHF